MSDFIDSETNKVTDKINKAKQCLKEIKHQEKLLRNAGFNYKISIENKGVILNDI